MELDGAEMLIWGATWGFRRSSSFSCDSLKPPFAAAPACN